MGNCVDGATMASELDVGGIGTIFLRAGRGGSSGQDACSLQDLRHAALAFEVRRAFRTAVQELGAGGR